MTSRQEHDHHFFKNARNISMDGQPTFNAFQGDQHSHYYYAPQHSKPKTYITGDENDEEAFTQ
ncbi:hypothetical protein V5O48_015120, partial [Marasmius crinis-equi]